MQLVFQCTFWTFPFFFFFCSIVAAVVCAAAAAAAAAATAVTATAAAAATAATAATAAADLGALAAHTVRAAVTGTTTTTTSTTSTSTPTTDTFPLAPTKHTKQRIVFSQQLVVLPRGRLFAVSVHHVLIIRSNTSFCIFLIGQNHSKINVDAWSSALFFRYSVVPMVLCLVSHHKKITALQFPRTNGSASIDAVAALGARAIHAGPAIGHSSQFKGRGSSQG